MSYQRNHNRFLRARWRRRILVPAWIVQAGLMFAIIGVFSYRLANTVRHYDEDRRAGKTPTVELVWQSTNVGLGLLCAVLTGLETHRLLAETLTPFFLLACNVLKMTAAGAILALDIVVYTQRTDGNWSTIGLALDGAALAAMLALGIYSIVAFARLAHTHGVYGGLGDTDVPADYGSSAPYAGLYDGSGVELSTQKQQYQYYGDRGGLVANSAGMGQAAPGGYTSMYDDVHTAYDPPRPRRVSYNHERDTQFDAYVGAVSIGTGTVISGNTTPRALPPQPLLNKGVIDGAISSELWGGGSMSLGGGGGAAGDRSNSLVGMGVVAAATPHRETVNRTASLSVELEHSAAVVPELDSVRDIPEKTGRQEADV